MPKSCLLVFPHCDRKRQNSPFQIGTFHFRFFFSCLPLRFNISYLPTFFPKQVYLYGVLSKNSVNRYWAAMAPLHRKRPRQFLLLWKGCSPGSHYFASVSGLAFLACSPPTVWVLWAAWLYNVIHFSLLTCMSHDVPDVPQQHPAALDRQRQETTTKQRERPAAANIHQQHLPKEESKRKARAPTKDTKEQPKKGREG